MVYILRMSKKKAQPMAVPNQVAARVLFESDRTCCVCRIRGKPVQIHHVDGNHSNHHLGNLAVLCLECHTDTQIKGGFHRKLDADQVILYRNDWIVIIAQERAAKTIGDISNKASGPDLESITSQLETLKENREYTLLAMTYNKLGNLELRDKYIEIALAADPSDYNIIYLRSMQGRADLIPDEVKKREIAFMFKHEDWAQLARLYHSIGDSRKRCAVLL